MRAGITDIVFCDSHCHAADERALIGNRIGILKMQTSLVISDSLSSDSFIDNEVMVICLLYKHLFDRIKHPTGEYAQFNLCSAS